MVPQPGDVLVSKRLAVVEHDISIVPHPSHLTCQTHDIAVEEGRALAELMNTDVWLTEDRIHFMKLASFREVSDALP